jgi:membrane protein implicated in regulation of membrane protease activity
MISSFRATIAAGAAAMLVSTAALAHHGWSWTEDGFFELTGTITAITYANPHPTLDVDVEGESWRVELATPRATANAGFMEDTAAIGDEVTAVGNRSREETEPRMKAVRLILKGETYDIYPNRVPAN